MLLLAIQCLLGLLYANASEWLIHKYILHGLGKNRHSFWAYHCYEHHAICYQHDMFDTGYKTVALTTWNTQTKELLVLIIIVLLHIPLFVIIPVFTGTVYLSIMLYYYKHRKAHLDSSWAKQHLLWHYEHHIYNTNANWCVTWPWCDYLLGTRVKHNQ